MARLVKIYNKMYDLSSGRFEGAGICSLLLSTIYIERLLKMNEDIDLTEQNIHRLFLAAFMLALKMYEDEIPFESTLAEHAGVSVSKLHQLESSFCNLIDYRLFVKTDEYLQLFSDTLSLCGFDIVPQCPPWLGIF